MHNILDTPIYKFMIKKLSSDQGWAMDKLIENFDRRFVRYAFAYGSRVKRQHGVRQADVQKGMLDMILVVRKGFHESNLTKNPHHYSMIARICPTRVTEFIQGSGVYFNTDIEMPGVGRIKYGTIEEDAYIKDLRRWRWLYVAGRLHKPVVDLIEPDYELKEAQAINLRHACNTALMLLPEKFTRSMLLRTIISLSYMGDVRMALAENPDKIDNILSAQQDEMWETYKYVMAKDVNSIMPREYPFVWPLDRRGLSWEQDNSPEVRLVRAMALPAWLRFRMDRPEDGLFTPELVQKGIENINRVSSKTHALKGTYSVDPVVSFNYVMDKIMKRFRNK